MRREVVQTPVVVHPSETQRPSEALRILPGLRWAVDNRLVAPVAGLLLTWGGMLTLMVGVEGRLPVLSQQYTGVTWGDLCLGFAYFCSVLAVRRYLLVKQFHVHPYKQLWRVAFAFLPLLALTVPELRDTYLHYGQANITTWGAWLSPTKFYHTFLLWLMGYLFLSVIWPALVRTPNTGLAWGYRGLIIAGLLGWAFFALVNDNFINLPRPDAHCVHVSDGWPWQRLEFWRGYAGCVPRD